MTTTLTLTPFTFDTESMNSFAIEATPNIPMTRFVPMMHELTAGDIGSPDHAADTGTTAIGYDGLDDFGVYRSRILDLTEATMDFVADLYAVLTPADLDFINMIDVIDLERIDSPCDAAKVSPRWLS
jgi:hypothetical protein